MNSPAIKRFIKENSSLFWYFKESEKENMSHNVLVEFILNYGDMKAVKKLFKLLGTEKVAEIFYKNNKGPRSNYQDVVANYFNLYFQSNVSQRNFK